MRAKRFKEVLGTLPFLFLLLFALQSFQGIARAQEQVFDNLGLFGGRINAIAIDPDNPDKMFVGTYLGDGVYRSDDGGANWQAVETNGQLGEDEFRNHEVFDIAMAATNSQIIWVAHDKWVEKSEDGGLTWTNISNSAMQRDCTNCPPDDDLRLCRAIVIHPLKPQTVFVGTGGPNESLRNGAVYRTDDGGKNWAKINQSGQFDYSIIDMDISTDGSRLYLGTRSIEFLGPTEAGGTLYTSANNGETWDVIFSGVPVLSGYHSVAVKPNDPNVVYAGSDRVLERHFFDGTQWNPSGLPAFSIFKRVRSISFDPTDPEHLYAGWEDSSTTSRDGQVSRCTDGIPITCDQLEEPGLTFVSLRVHPVSGVVFAGDKGRGLYRRSNVDQTWTPLNNGISAVIVYDVAVAPSDSSHMLAGTISGLYERRNLEGWSLIEEPSGFLNGEVRSVEFHPTNRQIFYAGTDVLRLAKTSNGGTDWSFAEIFSKDRGYVSDIAIHPVDANLLFISFYLNDGRGQIFKSIDGGDTFDQSFTFTSQDYPLNTVTVNPANPDQVFAGGGNFFPPGTAGDLLVSTNGGQDWSKTSLQNVIVNALLIDPTNPDLMYAGTGFSSGTNVPLYKSTDGGANWVPSFEEMPAEGSGNSVTDLVFHRQNTNVIFASTWLLGVYVSPNRGQRWLNLGTPEYAVHAIAAGSLFAGTEGGLLQLTGTGCIYGHVHDNLSEAAIEGAVVLTGINETRTSNGEYIMISPAGILDITASAPGYSDMAANKVVLQGGDVVKVDFPMTFGNGDSPPPGAPALIHPENGATIVGDTVEFRWQLSGDERGGVAQHLYYCKTADFRSCTTIRITSLGETDSFHAGSVSVLFVVGIVFAGHAGRRQRLLLMVATAGVLAMTFASCGQGTDSPSISSSNMVSRTVTGLEVGTTYYWKVALENGSGDQVESQTRYFSTQAARAGAEEPDGGRI